MKVYILEYSRPHPSEPASPVGAFSTYELAQTYAEEHGLDNWEVAVWEVDALVNADE